MKRESSKDKIIAAARTLFVDCGFAGTSTSQIAKLAEVNHSLIFYHFSSKENLWSEVKQNIVREAGQSKMLPSCYQPFPEFLSELVNKSIHFYRDNPDIIRLINWQRLERHQQHFTVTTISPETEAWLEAIRTYQRRGDVSEKLSPEFIMTFILSVVSTAALDPILFIQTDDQLKSYMAFSVLCLIKALKPD